MPPRTTRRSVAAASAVGAPSQNSPTAPTNLVRRTTTNFKSKQLKHSPEDEEEEEKVKLKDKPLLVDRLSTLSPELISLILLHLTNDEVDPNAVGVNAGALVNGAILIPAVTTTIDLQTLFQLSLVSKNLLPHIRTYLYRNLKIDTRTNAHAMHRTLHGNDISKMVKHIEADVATMAKTSSQWVGWFLFHSMHSLCGIIGSCRTLLTLTLFLPADASAWTQSLCSSLVDLKNLHTLTKDMERSGPGVPGSGRREGMDVGWKPRRNFSMWSVSQFIKPLASLKALHTLRLCGISSDSSTSPPLNPHNCRLTEVVLIEVNITNTDLLSLLGSAQHLKKLTLWRSSLLSKRGLTHVLKKCANLVEIRIGGSWFGAKDEDDTNFPLDNALPSLPHLRLIHVSGSLISPAILLHPTTNLNHLQVSSCPSFSPMAIHSALAKMKSDPVPVKKLSLPEMETVRSGTGEWNDKWKFTIKVICEAKGVLLDSSIETEVLSDSE